MGCGASVSPIGDSSLPNDTVLNVEKSVGSKSLYFKQTINARSPTLRLDTSDHVRKIHVKGSNFNYTLNYCYVSQRGYYPDALGKANQDSYIICEQILGDRSCNLFGVFDGHGETGDKCSHFAAQHITTNLAKEMKEKGGLKVLNNGSGEVMEVLNAAHAKANFSLHSAAIDDSLSGTTAITVLQKGDRLIVSNVGDSRAIIAKEVDGKLVYAPLSNDQTPYRKDERERLKKAGARIMTIDQIEGNEPIHENFGTDLGEELDEGGDPPRVWDSSLEQPGCAFSRSLGDAVAKQCGVIALPEVLEHQIQPEDRYAIIASDGVFEFITSQNVVDMISKYTDLLDAGKRVVQEAYRLWLTYDDRTDDITIIILHFSHFKEARKASAAAPTQPMKRNHSISHNLQQEVIMNDVGNRPVRKVMSRRKRMDVMDYWDPASEDAEFDFDAVEDNKTSQQNARISEMLNKNFMFSNLSPLQREHIVKVMKERKVRKGEVIIKEGDQGDEMYIVDSGHFAVSKLDAHGVDQTVFTYTREGSAFGELSLMYGKPRAASVAAKSDGKLWTIQRAAFRAVIMKQHKNQIGLLNMFQHIPHLQMLPATTLHRLCQACTEEWFDKGTVVVDEQSKGQKDWCFAVVITGILRFLAKEEGKKRHLRSEQTYFSLDEVGSKYTQVSTDCKTKLMCIPRAAFQSIVGEKIVESVKMEVQSKKCKGRRTNGALTKSMFLDPNTVQLPRMPDVKRFAIDHIITALGDSVEPFAYIGTYKDNESQKYCSIKVLAKIRCHRARLSERLLQERNLLASLSNTHSASEDEGRNDEGAFLPTVLATFSDGVFSYMIYKDVLVCDIGMALQHNAIGCEQIPYYLAAVFTALVAVHNFGFIHRFLNPVSIFMTNTGIPKLTDFRYAKQMDGTRSFTICGDPLYFAPEIVNSKGYDYGIDLWALGVLMYEMYEKETPFGNHETDETKIYHQLSAYTSGAEDSLKFCDGNGMPAAGKQLVKALLQFFVEKRAGYLDSAAVRSAEYFSAIDWSSLPSQTGQQVDIQGNAEQQLFDNLETFTSSVFDQF